MDFMEKTRNGLCFQGTQWTEMQNLMRRFIGLLRNWRRVYKIGVARGTRKKLKTSMPDLGGKPATGFHQ
jgi:hypothetical protein